MKSLKLTILAAACAMIQACSANAAPVYGNIGFEGAEVYADASGKQKTANTMQYGDIVEYDTNEKTPFVKVRNIATGAEGYVDTLKINAAQYPLEAPEVMADEQSECQLLNIQTSDSAEAISGWAFWKKGDGVMALNSVTLAYNTGRVFTQQNFYLGEIHPGYILLTEKIEYGEEKGEKLETPIVIYEDIASRAGIFQGGECYTPGGQQGGFDTDDWE